MTDADVIFGMGKPASDSQLKKYLADTDSEKTIELNKVCEEVVNYLSSNKK